MTSRRHADNLEFADTTGLRRSFADSRAGARRRPVCRWPALIAARRKCPTPPSTKRLWPHSECVLTETRTASSTNVRTWPSRAATPGTPAGRISRGAGTSRPNGSWLTRRHHPDTTADRHCSSNSGTSDQNCDHVQAANVPLEGAALGCGWTIRSTAAVILRTRDEETDQACPLNEAGPGAAQPCSNCSLKRTHRRTLTNSSGSGMHATGSPTVLAVFHRRLPERNGSADRLPAHVRDQPTTSRQQPPEPRHVKSQTRQWLDVGERAAVSRAAHAVACRETCLVAC